MDMGGTDLSELPLGPRSITTYGLTLLMYERGEGEWRNTVKYEVKSLENNSTHCLSKLS